MDYSLDSLVEMPRERWCQLKDSFKAWWPHGVPGYYALNTNIKHPELEEKFCIKFFCPYGKIENGVVAFTDKGTFKEVIVLPNGKDTSKLEETLAETKRVNWKQIICMPYAECDVVNIIRSLTSKIDLREIHHAATIKHFLDKNTKPFDNLKQPENTYVAELQAQHVKQVDDPWPHRYATSPKFFDVLIGNHLSYGLYSSEDHSLIAWVLINEVGFLTHLYVEEKHRKKGYAEFLMKHVSNEEIKKGRDVFCYVVENNISSLKLFRKLNYEVIGRGVWTFVSTDKDVKMT